MSDLRHRLAKAELHYTDFGSEATFREITRDYRLRYAGKTGCCAAHTFEWVGCFDPYHVALATGSDPRGGDPRGGRYSSSTEEDGYASYVGVSGHMPLVESLYRDVIERAEGIKGEFKPLTLVESEEVVAENWRGRDGL